MTETCYFTRCANDLPGNFEVAAPSLTATRLVNPSFYSRKLTVQAAEVTIRNEQCRRENVCVLTQRLPTK